MRDQVLGVAFGPRATTAEVRDLATGAVLASARVAHAELGAGPLDPTAWWRSIATAIARTGQPAPAALAVAGGHPGLVLLDEAGVVVRPLQPWDHAAATADALVEELGADRWVRRAGSLPDGAATVTRLAWLRRTDPTTFARLRRVLAPQEWLTYRLTGQPVTDEAGASETGLWSPHTGDWVADLLELVAPGAGGRWAGHLPVVVPAHERRWLGASAREQLGLRGRPVVAAGTGEAMAVALALGVRAHRAGVGLTEAVQVVAALDEPVVDPEGTVRSRAGADGGHLAVTGRGGGAGLLTAVAELLAVTEGELVRLARGAAAPAGVVLAGRGGDDAVLAGLGPSLNRAGLARAAAEGVAVAAADGLRALEGHGALGEDDEVAVGGPTELAQLVAAWVADLLQRPVLAVRGDLPATGACVRAAAALTGSTYDELAAAWHLGAGDEVVPGEGAGLAERWDAHAEARARLGG